MFFLIAEMSKRCNVTGNEGWVERSGTGLSLFRSPLTHNKWFCLALSFCWHCQVPMPIRLLSMGKCDDIPCTMPLAGTVSLSNYHLLAWLECLQWTVGVWRCAGFVFLLWTLWFRVDTITALAWVLLRLCLWHHWHTWESHVKLFLYPVYMIGHADEEVLYVFFSWWLILCQKLRGRL